MRFTTIEKWIGVVGGGAAILGGTYWLGQLENRVGQLEKADVLRIGSRGQNCQLIVGKLVERPTDKDLKALAGEWGCANMPASFTQPKKPTKLCADGTVVFAGDRCPEPQANADQ